MDSTTTKAHWWRRPALPAIVLNFTGETNRFAGGRQRPGVTPSRLAHQDRQYQRRVVHRRHSVIRICPHCAATIEYHNASRLLRYLIIVPGTSQLT
jgi:hypothetical protein